MNFNLLQDYEQSFRYFQSFATKNRRKFSAFARFFSSDFVEFRREFATLPFIKIISGYYPFVMIREDDNESKLFFFLSFLPDQAEIATSCTQDDN